MSDSDNDEGHASHPQPAIISAGARERRAPKSKLTRHSVFLCYSDDREETQFVAVLTRTVENRFLVFCAFTALSAVFYAIQKATSGFADDIAMYGGAGAALALIIEVAMKTERAKAFVTSVLDVNIDKFREALSAVTLTALSGGLSYTAAVLLPHRPCQWLVAYDNRTFGCSQRLFGVWFATTLLPVILGKPRLIFVSVHLAVTFLMLLPMEYATVGARVSVSWLGIALLFVALCWSLKRVDEQRQRDHFEVQAIVADRLVELNRANAALRTFILSIAPKHLHRRLRLASSSTAASPIVDASLSAVVLHVDVHDVASYLASTLPERAALGMVALQHHCAKHGAASGLTLVGAAGDTSLLVANLFGPTVSLEASVKCALELINSFPPQHGLQCRCGVAQGALAGAAIGVTSLRFDVFGPAAAAAREAARSCPPRCVQVDHSLVEQLRGAFAFSDDDNPCVATFALDDDDEDDESAAKVRDQEVSTRATVDATAGLNESDDALDEVLVQLSSGDAGLRAAAGRVRELAFPAAMAESEVLALRSRWCSLWTTFDDANIAKQEADSRMRADRVLFTRCCAFFAALLSGIIAAIVTERHASADTPLAISIIILCACVVSLGVLGASIGVNGASRVNGYVFLVIMALQMVAVSLARPSLVGDDPSFALFIGTIAIVVSGLLVTEVLGAQAALLLGHFVLIFAFRPLVILGNIMYVPLFSLAIVFITLRRDAQRKQLFVDGLCAENLLKGLEAHKELQGAIAHGLIPRQLHHVLGRINRAVHPLLGWIAPDCVVIAVRCDGELEAIDPTRLSDSAQSWAQTASDTLEQVLSALRCGLSGGDARLSSSLEMISVFGGRILLAGPLDDPFAGGSRVSDATLLESVSNALLFVTALLQSSLRVSIAVSIEQVVNSLHFTDFPSFNLFGPAVQLATSMLDAAPPRCAVITEKLAALYDRECRSRLPLASAIEFGDPVSWRIKGVGTVRCRVIRATNEGTTRNPLLPPLALHHDTAAERNE